MNRGTWLLIVAMAGVLVLLFAAAWLHYPGRAPVKLPAENCNAELWKHVYRPERLRVVEACTAVEGRVVKVQREGDGDLHIGLDPEDKSVLNLVNALHGHGRLVVEVICEHAPDSGAAQAACARFSSSIALPRAGDRIRVTGAYVTDRENGWNEIHPVTRIEVLR